jgi:hypothetical protein
MAASSVVSLLVPAMLCELGWNHKWAVVLREGDAAFRRRTQLAPH